MSANDGDDYHYHYLLFIFIHIGSLIGTDADELGQCLQGVHFQIQEDGLRFLVQDAHIEIGVGSEGDRNGDECQECGHEFRCVLKDDHLNSQRIGVTVHCVLLVDGIVDRDQLE